MRRGGAPPAIPQPDSADGRTIHVARKKPINVGIVGLGRAGMNMHVGELTRPERKSKFNIVAGCDPLVDRLDTLQDKFPQACGYKTIQELLADPEVELVSIASRSLEHVPHALLALKAGKHVFLEKPIAVTFNEAKKLKPAASRAKGKLFIRHNRRFEPGFVHIQSIIDSGILGKVHLIKLRRNQFQRRDDWQTLIDCGGGQALNWGPHLIDHALRFLGGSYKDLWADLKSIACAGDAEDHLKLLLRGKTGCVVDIEISGAAALSEPIYLVHGSKGSLTSDEKTIHLRYLDPKKKLKPRRAKSGTPRAGFGSPDDLTWIEKTIQVAPKPKCDTSSIWDHLYDALRNGKPFPIKFDEALEVMRVIEQMKRGTPFVGVTSQSGRKSASTRGRKKR